MRFLDKLVRLNGKEIHSAAPNAIKSTLRRDKKDRKSIKKRGNN